MIRSVSALCMLAFASSCAEEAPTGRYFAVTVSGEENMCTSGAGASEPYEYRLVVEGQTAQIFIDETFFADGVLDGCTLAYTSATFTSFRRINDNEFADVRWRIDGEALIDLDGGNACVEMGNDWLGSETIEVINAGQGADVVAGCTYTASVVGQFVEFIRPEAAELTLSTEY